MAEISIVIPLHNEEENVQPLMEAVYDSMENFDYELILVNDGSTDKSLEKLREYQQEKTSIINLNQRYGQSAAIKAGIDNSSGKYIVMLDGDLQNHPKDIPFLIDCIKVKDIEIIQGFRKERHDQWLKIIPSRIANTLIRFVFNFPLHDVGCALKIVKREALKDFYYFDGFHRYLSLLLFENKYKVDEVIVSHYPRSHGKSKYGLGRMRRVIRHLYLIKKDKINILHEIDYIVMSKF